MGDIFGKKRLSGRPPTGLEWSRDGRTLFFLKPSRSDAKVLDLWRVSFDGADGAGGSVGGGEPTPRLLVSADELSKKGKARLTEAQRAAQERRRVRHRGITSFGLDEVGKGIVLPVAGYLYYYDLRSGAVTKLFDEPGGELDAKLSPDGRTLAFVRGGEVRLLDLETKKERTLTSGASETIKNGVAEFIAQEELGRYTGYWWSPKSDRIVFAQVDLSPVGVVLRPRYSSSGVEVVRQRYPAAGTENAKVKLGIVDVGSKETVWVEMGEREPFYLLRVDWTERGVAFQTLSRDHRALTLRLADPETGSSRVLLTEKDTRYINPHDDFRPLKETGGFLWSSEREGRRQIHVYDWEGREQRQLSKKPLFIHEIEAVDEKGGWVYASVPVDRAMELHLYRFCLRGERKPERVTSKRGWHEVEMSRRAKRYVDSYSALTLPPQVRVHASSGEETLVLDENRAKRLEELALADTRMVEIRAEDGTALNGVLFEPPGFDRRGRYPAIIYTYGGPHGRAAANRWSRMELWHHYMAQRGFLVLAFDGRGTGYRGKEFEAKLYKAFGEVDVADMKAAAEWLKNKSWVNGRRIGLWGWSYGGYLTVMTLLRSKRLFGAGVAVAPLADWSLYDTAYTERYLGHPDENEEIYRRANPINEVDRLATSLLLIHGMSDDNVLLRHTLMLASALQNKNKRFDMMLYPGKRHSIKGRATRTHLLTGIVDYFQSRLE